MTYMTPQELRRQQQIARQLPSDPRAAAEMIKAMQSDTSRRGVTDG